MKLIKLWINCADIEQVLVWKWFLNVYIKIYLKFAKLLPGEIINVRETGKDVFVRKHEEFKVLAFSKQYQIILLQDFDFRGSNLTALIQK